jgi:diguanylate cyclase (GGDEF)-like protein
LSEETDDKQQARSLPSAPELVAQRLIRQLLDSAASTLVLGLLVGYVVYSAIARSGDAPMADDWVAALTLLTVARLILIVHLRRWLDGGHVRSVGLLYAGLGFVGGIVWALLIGFDDPDASVATRLMVLITLVAMPIAGLSSNAIYKPAFYAFSVPIFASMFYWAWSESHGLVLEFTALAGAYVTLVTIVATRYNESMRRSILRDLENERLLREVGAMNSKLQDLAYRDPLTGLSNRRSFEETAEQMLRRLRPGDVLVLMLIDVDDFKWINDSLGHAAGDQVLVTLSRRIEETSRLSEIVAQSPPGTARIGGDEFIVIYRLDAKASVETLAARILESASSAMDLGGREYRPSISIGAALAPTHATTLDALLHYADAAMYEAKGAGGSRFVVAVPEATEKSSAGAADAPIASGHTVA